jgi:hypothetical protein
MIPMNRLPDETGVGTTGTTVAEGCAAVGTGNIPGGLIEVAAPTGADARVDWVVQVGRGDLSDTAPKRLFSVTGGPCNVRTSGAVNVEDKLNVRDAQGRFGPVGVSDKTVYFVALEAATGADQYIGVRPVAGE